jgi:hypothetical protein
VLAAFEEDEEVGFYGMASFLRGSYYEQGTLLNLADEDMPELDSARVVRAVNEVIEAFQPDDPYDPLFRLARKLGDKQTLQNPRASAKRFYLGLLLLADRLIQDGACVLTDLPWENRDELELLWDAAWKKVRTGEGEYPILRALQLAEEKPLFSHEKNALTRKFLSMAYYLQQIRGKEPILLPIGDDLAERLDCCIRTLSTLISNAMDDGYLQCVNRKYNPKAKIARSFKFIGKPEE